jgi:hypothetical protein
MLIQWQELYVALLVIFNGIAKLGIMAIHQTKKAPLRAATGPKVNPKPREK